MLSASQDKQDELGQWRTSRINMQGALGITAARAQAQAQAQARVQARTRARAQKPIMCILDLMMMPMTMTLPLDPLPISDYLCVFSPSGSLDCDHFTSC